MKESSRIVAAGIPTLGKLAGHTTEMSQHLHLQQKEKHQVSLDNVRILDREADEDAQTRPEQGSEDAMRSPTVGIASSRPPATCSHRVVFTVPK